MSKPPSLWAQLKSLTWSDVKLLAGLAGTIVCIFAFVAFTRGPLHRFMAALGFERTSGAWALMLFGLLAVVGILAACVEAVNRLRAKKTT